MAPKQSLLPLYAFVKEPSKKMARKHQRLVKKAENQPKPKKRGMSGWLKKQIRQRQEEEEKKQRGADTWREWLRVKEMDKPHIDPVLLFQAYGEAPPLEAPNGHPIYPEDLDTSVDEENSQELSDGHDLYLERSEEEDVDEEEQGEQQEDLDLEDDDDEEDEEHRELDVEEEEEEEEEM